MYQGREDRSSSEPFCLRASFRSSPTGKLHSATCKFSNHSKSPSAIFLLSYKYAVCRDRNEKVVKFLLDQGADPSIEESPRRLTPLRFALWMGKLAPSSELYPLLPYIRILLKHSKDLVYGSAQDVVDGVLSEFYGSDEEFRYLQQHCCPWFYQMPQSTRVEVATRISSDASGACHIPTLIRTILGTDPLKANDLQTRCYLPMFSGETTLAHCVAKQSGRDKARLRIRRQRQGVLPYEYQTFVRDFPDHYQTMRQSFRESWSNLFLEILQAGIDIHLVVDRKTPFLAFLEGHLAWQVSFSKSTQCPCIDIEALNSGIRAWLKDLKATGLSLEKFGAKEWCIWRRGDVQREFIGNVLRVTGMSYGPSPDDWYLWLSEVSDSFAGDFWALIAQPVVSMPGEWPEE